MRYFDNYAYYYELAGDEKDGFKKLKSEKLEYLAHLKEILTEKYDALPKKEYHSMYPSRTEPGHMITLKREHVIFIMHLERTEEKIEGGTAVLHEVDLIFEKGSFAKVTKRTDMGHDRARMSFRVHKWGDERMLTVLKKDKVFRQFVKRMNEVL
ncbi:MAG: hypothetical protein GQ477_02880 [Nanohaloarchaea archaeon]|nr:hypothetical protein [Candidatus Nanohaloarchaea archaeon]